jgi:hypothetical protein
MTRWGSTTSLTRTGGGSWFNERPLDRIWIKAEASEALRWKHNHFVCLNKGLQNLYSSVRLRSAPPTFSLLSLDLHTPDRCVGIRSGMAIYCANVVSDGMVPPWTPSQPRPAWARRPAASQKEIRHVSRSLPKWGRIAKALRKLRFQCRAGVRVGLGAEKAAPFLFSAASLSAFLLHPHSPTGLALGRQ